VRGSVELLRRSLFGKLAPSDDASGVVVYMTGWTTPAPAATARLDQHDEQFDPRVLAIVQGQRVTFPNRDRIYHNVFSVSPLASFDLGQYKSSDAPRDVAFERPGLVPVYCNIHPQMLSYVVVLENDAHAVTGKDGRFAFERVPAGEVAVHAWAPGAERVSESLRLAPGETAEVSLRLEQTQRIAPHKRKDGSDYPKPGYEE
jgi:plastocyanin